MSTFFVFLLLLLCILFILFNFRKTSLVIVSILITSYILIGNGFLPAYLLHNLQFPYSQTSPINWKKTNIIILLGAGTSKDPKSNEINPAYYHFQEFRKLQSFIANVKILMQAVIF